MNSEDICKIQYTRPLLSVQDIVRYIDKGTEYSKTEIFEEEESIDYLGAIILNPTYQREYRSSIKEESLIVESILLNIPIPEVFLVRIPNNNIQIRNVMDGRHRLNAIYRFIKGKYRLQGVDLIEKLNEIASDNQLPKYNGKSFNDLNSEDKIKILTYKISVLEFDELGDGEIERELFTRYNKATKPLEAQEIRYATYASKTSQYVTSFINNLKDQQKENPLCKIYNLTKTRREKQKIHQNIFVILHIIEMGLNTRLTKSTEIAEEYMRIKNNDYIKNIESEKIATLFNQFNALVLKISTKVEYPFSSRAYSGKTGSGTYLFQIGIAMAIASLFYYCEIIIDDNYNFIDDIASCVRDMMRDDQVYSACPTNSKTLADNLIEISNNEYMHIRFNQEKLEKLKLSYSK